MSGCRIVVLLGVISFPAADVKADASDLFHEPAANVAEFILPRIGCENPRTIGVKNDVFGCDWNRSGGIRIHSHLLGKTGGSAKDTLEQRSSMLFNWMEQSNTGHVEAETIVRRLLRGLEIQNEDQIIASFFRAGGGGLETFRQGSLVITTEAVSGDHTLAIGTKDDVMFMIGR